MHIESSSLPDLHKTGVYAIVNLANNKLYVGSTTQSFILRCNQHEQELVRKTHKNAYLQNAWSKAGSDYFQFRILECTSKSETLTREQYWMDFHQVTFLGYNINPNASGTPNLSLETVAKRAATFQQTNRQAMGYYRQLKDGTLTLNLVPAKYLKLVLAKVNMVPYNKGLTAEHMDYSFLKGVTKEVSEKSIAARMACSRKARDKSKAVDIYDYTGKFLMRFSSVIAVVEYAHTAHQLPLIMRVANGSRDLRLPNVNNCCNGHTRHHKGLFFRYEGSDLPVEPLQPRDIHFRWSEFPTNQLLLHRETDVEKEGNIGER